jgi:hypothetical protein
MLPWSDRHLRLNVGETVLVRIAAGEIGHTAGAEGATAPETLRQMNRAIT